MDYIDIFIYFGLSALAGAINSVAGGGTFLTFPFFILTGLSPLGANIMSTIALWPGAVASAFAYRKLIVLERKKIIELMAVSMLGCLIGTSILLLLPEKSFEAAVPWLLLFATLLFTFGGKIKFPPGAAKRAVAVQLAIAVYGGYFGAGQGILMLAMLQLLGMHHIHQMNAVKSLLGASINVVAFVIFIVTGKVVWALAPVMIAGAIVGGYFGSHGAMRVSPQKVRWFVSAVGFAMTAYFFLHGT